MNDYEKAIKIMDEMKYHGWYKILREGYSSILKLPWCEIDLD